MAVNPEVDSLKAKRAATRDRSKAEASAAQPSMADKPVMIGESTSRRFPLLGDPAEPRVVAEASGALFGVQPGEPVAGYRVATEDVFETIVPAGCRTGTSRMRWARGNHVPTEVYETWERERNAATTPETTPEATPETTPPA